MTTLDLASANDPDQRVFLRVDWAGYLQLLELRGDTSGPRIAYSDGVAELMSPSRSHEYIKTTIARILEAWALREGIFFDGYGSWTLKSDRHQRGLEPDECYVLVDPGDAEPEGPDLAIEVVWTRGGLKKLPIYQALGVREVWIWEGGDIGVFALRAEGYERVDGSVLLPQVDRAKLARCALLTPQSAAVRAFLGG